MSQTETDIKFGLGVNAYDLIVLECARQVSALSTRESQQRAWAPEVPARLWKEMHHVRAKRLVWHMEIKGSIR